MCIVYSSYSTHTLEHTRRYIRFSLSHVYGNVLYILIDVRTIHKKRTRALARDTGSQGFIPVGRSTRHNTDVSAPRKHHKTEFSRRCRPFVRVLASLDHRGRENSTTLVETMLSQCLDYGGDLEGAKYICSIDPTPTARLTSGIGTGPIGLYI